MELHMRNAALLLMLTAILSPSFAAQPQPETSTAGCYEIVTPFRGDTGLILLNRCNGSTWMMTRDPMLGTDQRPNGSSTFSWHPIETAKGPPVLFDLVPRLPTVTRPNGTNPASPGANPQTSLPPE